jgi:hypothetical protein
MPTFTIDQKAYIPALNTGFLFLVQDDPDGAGTYYKIPWGQISGDLNNAVYSTGQTLHNYLTNFSGNSQCFSTGINPTGLDTYYVSFPLGAFPSTPRVFPSIEISGENMYSINITGRTNQGFYSKFSENIGESGVILHVFATINS